MNSDFFCGGPLPSNQILSYLYTITKTSRRIDLAVSFVRLSGIRLLLPLFRPLKEGGVSIRLLCGSYMGITEPAALAILLHELHDSAQLRLFEDPLVSFHPKGWIFYDEKNEPSILVGSSNLSRSALTCGIEWNTAIGWSGNEKAITKMIDSFEDLFARSRILDEEAIADYRQSRIPFQSGKWMEMFSSGGDQPESEDLVSANALQAEALLKLEESRTRGDVRALVQAATGTGKTYLAALDSMQFSRVLFVAHRREILNQAAKAFHRVRPDDSIGFLDGSNKEIDCTLVFASVATLAKASVLDPAVLAPDAFDYIVIDEFHHAAAGQYRKILDYFQPKFLLGLTATPYRLDGRDLYALCDYNVPYQMELFDAIAQGYLSPFRYYGIYDPTDYEQVKLRGMRFDPGQLEALYDQNEARASLIARHYRKHASRRALGFCVSRLHARYMARYFNGQGIASASVVSNPDLSAGSTDMERNTALEKLANGELRVLFSVDLFNEGTDIPNLDTVLFLRPTESAVVYLQQLGRGLRKAPDKDYLTVLDFIGNYRTAAFGPSLLAASNGPISQTMLASSLPPTCVVDFDLQLIDLFENLARRKETPMVRVAKMIDDVQECLGHLPSRLELWQNLGDEDIAFCMDHKKVSPLHHYADVLQGLHRLDPAREALYAQRAGDFLRLIETTQLTRVYKLAVLEVLQIDIENNGRISADYSAETILAAWKRFFVHSGRWIDLDVKSRCEFEAIADTMHLKKIREMPVLHLVKSSKGWFTSSKQALLHIEGLSENLQEDPLFLDEIRDILSVRCEMYYATRFQDEKRIVKSKRKPKSSLH